MKEKKKHNLIGQGLSETSVFLNSGFALLFTAFVCLLLPGAVTHAYAFQIESEEEVPPISAPVERYDYAAQWWEYGDYEQVITLITPLLFPEPDTAFDDSQLLRAYLILGSSQFFTSGGPASHDAFYHLLLLEPDYELDAFLYPPAMVGYLDELRLLYQEDLDEIRLSRAPAQFDDSAAAVYVERRVEQRSVVVSMLPLGIGHFINEETGWGATYLGLEAALGMTSLAMFIVNERSRDENGFFVDADLVALRQNVQIGTGIAFVGVLAVNMLHGILIHNDVVEISYGVVDEGFEERREQGGNRLHVLPGWDRERFLIQFVGHWPQD